MVLVHNNAANAALKVRLCQWLLLLGQLYWYRSFLPTLHRSSDTGNYRVKRVVRGADMLPCH